MSKAKERFHRVMADHFASGGTVKDDEITFGDHEEYLSGESDDSGQLEDLPSAGELTGEESPESKAKERLKKIRAGK